MLLVEHKYRPIRGEVLLLGRQVVLMTTTEAEALVDRMGIKRPSGSFVETGKIPNQFGRELISDESFFSLFSDAVVSACDVSDHEAADFIFDLSAEVPHELRGRFDFIYNGSVLDNVFDPAACIRHVSKMLKPDGVVMGYEGMAHAGAVYLKFTPEWFFDYYALNNFADFQSYVFTYPDIHADPVDTFEWSAFTDFGELAKPMPLDRDALVVAIAQNSPDATIGKVPIQGVYRSGQHEAYKRAFERYAASTRRSALAAIFPPLAPPPMVPAPGIAGLLGKKRPAEMSPPSDGHRYLGKLGAPVFLGGT